MGFGLPYGYGEKVYDWLTGGPDLPGCEPAKKTCASTLCSWEAIEAFGGKCWKMNGLQVPITLKEGGGRWADGIRESYQKVVSS